MKKLFFTLSIPVLIFGMLASCGGGGKEYTEESQDDNTAAEEPMEEEAPTFSGKTVVGVIHSVADLAAWEAVYEEVSVPEARIAYYENVDNPDEIVVFEFTTSHAEAKEQFASDDLKATMERAGVNSMPEFTYYDMQYLNTEATDAIYRVGISHEVSDYDAWKVKFDEDEARRTEAGMVLRGLAKDADNPNLIHVVWSTNDIEPARGMLADPALKTAMEEAGVVSEPVAYFWKQPGS